MSNQDVKFYPAESENIEYKSAQSGNLSEDIWEPITAFSNADGGFIVFGVDEKGNEIGVPPDAIDHLQQNFVTLCATAFNHKLYPEITVEDSIIRAFIPPAPAALRPIFSTSRGLPKGGRVRVGSINVRL